MNSTAHPEEKGRVLYIGICVAPKGMVCESFFRDFWPFWSEIG